jgi:hypothetical protein
VFTVYHTDKHLKNPKNIINVAIIVNKNAFHLHISFSLNTEGTPHYICTTSLAL